MKKIKTSYLILYVFLMLLPLILTLAALPHLPEEIPAHYGFSGQVDRWGNKYEALIFPVITICFGALMAPDRMARPPIRKKAERIICAPA